MTAAQIIEKFELYVDDSTELSSQEELDLLNKVYLRIASLRDWKIFTKEATGSMASTTTITLPSDFDHLTETYNYTDNSISTEIGAKPVYVYINNVAYQVVNWADRRQYANNNGVCYVDLINSVIKFPVAQSSGATYSFDYKYVPTALTTSDSPTFPARFHDAIYHGMCVDDMVIQLFDKARSYASENQSMYDRYLTEMAYWDAQLSMN